MCCLVFALCWIGCSLFLALVLSCFVYHVRNPPSDVLGVQYLYCVRTRIVLHFFANSCFGSPPPLHTGFVGVSPRCGKPLLTLLTLLTRNKVVCTRWLAGVANAFLA